jgi:predicted helicase
MIEYFLSSIDHLFQCGCILIGYLTVELSQLPSIFPTPDAENLAIVVSGKGADWFDASITDRIVDLGSMYNTQVFPLYAYTEVKTLYGTTSQKQDTTSQTKP